MKNMPQNQYFPANAKKMDVHCLESGNISLSAVYGYNIMHVAKLGFGSWRIPFSLIRDTFGYMFISIWGTQIFSSYSSSEPLIFLSILFHIFLGWLFCTVEYEVQQLVRLRFNTLKMLNRQTHPCMLCQLLQDTQDEKLISILTSTHAAHAFHQDDHDDVHKWRKQAARAKCVKSVAGIKSAIYVKSATYVQLVYFSRYSGPIWSFKASLSL